MSPRLPGGLGGPAYVITYARMSTGAVSQNGVGSRIKALREAMDLSLRDLAERSGVSAPMLSQVERGETSPTLQVAKRIAAGLELRLSQLLRLDEDGAVTLVRRGERRQGPAPIKGHSYEILTPPGSRETALVERGTVILHCDGQRYELLDGDCVTFDADLNHHFENPGPEEAVLLAVLSAGLRRS
jgi:transcriptional regulator with XRE-family HTH domain